MGTADPAQLPALHRDAGHTLLLLAHTLETDDDVAELTLAAVDADDSVLVRLEAAIRVALSCPDLRSNVPRRLPRAYVRMGRAHMTLQSSLGTRFSTALKIIA